MYIYTHVYVAIYNSYIHILYPIYYSIAVKCAGVYERKFVELYEDRNAGGTRACSLYQKIKEGRCIFDDESIQSEIRCNCCYQYNEWKKNHQSSAKKLICLADKPFHYAILPDKDVKVIVNGKEQQYKGTILSTSSTGTALPFGKHPYQCSLEHGKSSPLLHKLNRSTHLKHPRSELQKLVWCINFAQSQILNVLCKFSKRSQS